MKVLQSKIFLILVAVLVVAGGVGSWQFVKNKPVTKPSSTALDCPLQDLKLEPKNSWKNYTSKNLGVSFSYPPKLEVKETERLGISLSLPSPETTLEERTPMGCRFDIGVGAYTFEYTPKTAQEELERLSNLPDTKTTKINLAGIPAIWNEVITLDGNGDLSVYFVYRVKVYRISTTVSTDLQGNFSPKHVEVFKAILETIRFTD